MAIEWKDSTSYSRDKPRIPTCWSANVGGFHITVLTSHIYAKDKWVMHCNPWFDTHPIPGNIELWDTDRAQRAALRLVRAKMEPAWKALDSAVTVT